MPDPKKASVITDIQERPRTGGSLLPQSTGGTQPEAQNTASPDTPSGPGMSPTFRTSRQRGGDRARRRRCGLGALMRGLLQHDRLDQIKTRRRGNMLRV